MKNLIMIFSIVLSYSSFLANASESISLSPNFHILFVTSKNLDDSCESDSFRSVYFREYQNRYNERLISLELKLNQLQETNQVLVQLIGRSESKINAIQIEFSTSKDVAQNLKNDWTNTYNRAKKQWFRITEDFDCSGEEISFVQNLSIKIH